jgi:hypothetical protein
MKFSYENKQKNTSHSPRNEKFEFTDPNKILELNFIYIVESGIKHHKPYFYEFSGCRNGFSCRERSQYQGETT